MHNTDMTFMDYKMQNSNRGGTGISSFELGTLCEFVRYIHIDYLVQDCYNSKKFFFFSGQRFENVMNIYIHCSFELKYF